MVKGIQILLAFLILLATLFTLGAAEGGQKVAHAASPNYVLCQSTRAIQQAYKINATGEWYGEVWLYGIFDSRAYKYCGQMYGTYHIAHRQTPDHGASVNWDEHFTFDSGSLAAHSHGTGSGYSYFGSHPSTNTSCADESVVLSASNEGNLLLDTGQICNSTSLRYTYQPLARRAR